MQKLVNFLEQHVQWVVLGLGGLYLLFMVWTYVINKPVTVDVAGQTVAPGEVDRIVKEKSDQLDAAMKRPAPPIVITVAKPVDQFLAAINASPKIPTLPVIAFTAPTGKLDAPVVVVGGNAPNVPNMPNPGPGPVVQVEALPTPPKPIDVLTRRGRSTAGIPDAAGVVDPGNAGLGPVKLIDKDWVTVRFTVDRAKLKDSFEASKIPPIFMKALFLKTELIREEQLADGTWGKQVVVPPLKMGKAMPFPGEADKAGHINYNEWARSNQPEIMQPLFYAVSKGDRWGVPGMEDKEVVAENVVAFDPAQYLDKASDLSKLTTEQKAEVMKARRAAQLEADRVRREQNQGQGRPPRGGEGGEFPGGGGRRGGGGGPGAGGEPSRPFQDRGGQFQPFPGGQPFQPGGEGAMGGEGQNPQATINNINLALEFPLPPGEFNPADAAVQNITGWIHDETVEPGVTYRYKVRYKMKNPIYQTVNVAKNPADANKFSVTSLESEWTSPVIIPELTSFYLASNFNADSRNVKFEVFKFQDGVLHSQSFTVYPGDAIGRTEKGVDFGTGWTLVDMRKNGAKSNSDFVVITDPTGRMQQRIYTTDRDDPDAKKLRQQLTQQQQAAAGG